MPLKAHLTADELRRMENYHARPANGNSSVSRYISPEEIYARQAASPCVGSSPSHAPHQATVPDTVSAGVLQGHAATSSSSCSSPLSSSCSSAALSGISSRVHPDSSSLHRSGKEQVATLQRASKKRKFQPAVPQLISERHVCADNELVATTSAQRPVHCCPFPTCSRHQRGWLTAESMLTHVAKCPYQCWC